MQQAGGEMVSRDVILDWYDAWNRRDWSKVSTLLDERFECCDMALGKTMHGKDDYLDYAQNFAATFPDAKFNIDRIAGSLASGDVVVVEYRCSGTQSGFFGLFSPSNLKAQFYFCDLLRFHNGKLTNCRIYWDLYGPLADLGHVVSRRLPRKTTRAA